MGLSGFFTDATALLVQRLLAGVASAFVFIAGGLLAARLGALAAAAHGLLLGLYYGGTGLGIVLSALLVPAMLQAAAHALMAHGWAWAWWALAGGLLAATAVLVARARAAGAGRHRRQRRAMARGTSLYLARLRARPGGLCHVWRGLHRLHDVCDRAAARAGRGASAVTLFYALLGVAVVASSRIWAGLLDRAKGGGALATLNGCWVAPRCCPRSPQPGRWCCCRACCLAAVFLSVVASTTALVRHNLPPAQWAAGISAFTIVFAAGQIVGPTVVGWIADGPGGLARGLVFSALALWVGAALAWRQKPLA
jgi:hypothetical protein